LVGRESYRAIFGASLLRPGSNSIDFSLNQTSGNFRISDVVLWFQAGSF
jgi:hypothetical protein